MSYVHRYALVTYGGKGFFSAAQHVVAGNELFSHGNFDHLNALLANIEFCEFSKLILLRFFLLASL